MNLMAKRHGSTYKSMQYLPGSGVRARAMLQGRIKASAVDSRRRNMLREQGRGQFEFLPIPKFHATDETLEAAWIAAAEGGEGSGGRDSPLLLRDGRGRSLSR